MKRKLNYLEKAQILFHMSLRPVNDPFRKLKMRLLHLAMSGDAKAARQLKMLAQHTLALSGK